MSAVLQPDSRQAAASGNAQRLLGLTFRTHAAGRQLRRLLSQTVERWQLSDTEALVLWLCVQPEPGSGRRPALDGKVQCDLAGSLGISPAQMSGMVDRLQRRGLVACERSSLDRRRQICRLTDDGQTLLREIETKLAELTPQLDSTISAQDQHRFETLAQQLAEAATAAPRLKTFAPDCDTPDQTSCEGAAQ